MHIALEAGQGFNAHPACPRQLLAPLLYRHDGLVWPACLQFVQADLQARRPELVAKSDERRYLEAAQYASVARQLLNYHAALARQSGERIVRLLGMRDALMADNLAYMVLRERGRGKALVFAHNSHLQRGKAELQLGSDVYLN